MALTINIYIIFFCEIYRLIKYGYVFLNMDIYMNTLFLPRSIWYIV